MSPTRRSLREMKGFVFDLDGCVWTGEVLTPGAAQVLALLRGQGRGVSFLTNNSRARAATMQDKLVRLGVQAEEREVLTPLEILGEVITRQWGPSHVLAIGGGEMEQVIRDAGHTLVGTDRFREATVVVVGNDFAFTYERLTAASRAVAAGAIFLTPNIDPRLPVEDGDFLPGRGRAPDRGRQARAPALRARARAHGLHGGRGRHGGRQHRLRHPRRATHRNDRRALRPQGRPRRRGSLSSEVHEPAPPAPRRLACAGAAPFRRAARARRPRRAQAVPGGGPTPGLDHRRDPVRRGGVFRADQRRAEPGAARGRGARAPAPALERAPPRHAPEGGGAVHGRRQYLRAAQAAAPGGAARTDRRARSHRHALRWGQRGGQRGGAQYPHDQ